jgi:hypothetical protein
VNLEVAYAITGFFCAVTCVIVAHGAWGSKPFVSREPVGIAIIAGSLAGLAWLNWYPAQNEWISIAAIVLSIVAAWAAWKDSTAANAAMRRGRKPT